MSGIVVGVEPTAEGRAAVAWALREAAERALPLFAVRAWTDAITAGTAGTAGIVIGDSQRAEREAARLARTLVHQVATGMAGVDQVDVRICAYRGPAGPALAHMAERHQLLVVGARRANSPSPALLGSVTEHVLHHAPGPVAVIGAPGAATGPPPRVVVGVDHSEASLVALDWAADRADRQGLTLAPVLVREEVLTDATAGGRSLSGADLAVSDLRALRCAVPADAHVRIEPAILTGPPGKALAAYAEPQDVLVVGSHAHNAASGVRLGATSSYLAERDPCPVVVVRG